MFSRHFSAVCVLLGVALFWSCREAEQESPPPVAGTYSSPDELARDFLDSLYRKDVESLKAFALSEDEFRLHVWPELPSSRPERGVPFEYAWGDLNQKSTNSLRRTYDRYGGRKLTYIRIEFEDETTYETFKVHRDARVVVRDEETAKELRLDLVRLILEKDGRFKLFSYVTD